MDSGRLITTLPVHVLSLHSPYLVILRHAFTVVRLALALKETVLTVSVLTAPREAGLAVLCRYHSERIILVII